MGALIELTVLNAPFRDNGGGGGGAYLERVRPFPFIPRSPPAPVTHPFDISLCYVWYKAVQQDFFFPAER